MLIVFKLQNIFYTDMANLLYAIFTPYATTSLSITNHKSESNELACQEYEIIVLG